MDDRPRNSGASNEQGSFSAARERFEKTQQVHLDLREPVTRDEAGVAPGERAYIVERAGGDRFLDVELTVPGGQVLDVAAIGVVFAGPGQPPGTGLDKIVVNGVAEDLPAAQDAVEVVVSVLGLDADEVRRFFERVRPGKDSRDQTVLIGAPRGYLRPVVEVFYRGSEDRLTINITLSWDPVAEAVPGTQPTPA